MDGLDVSIAGYIEPREEPLVGSSSVLRLDGVDGVVDLSQSIEHELFTLDGEHQFEFLNTSIEDALALSQCKNHSGGAVVVKEEPKQKTTTKRSSLSAIRIQSSNKRQKIQILSKPPTSTVISSATPNIQTSQISADVSASLLGDGNARYISSLLGEEAASLSQAVVQSPVVGQYRLATATNGKVYLLLDQTAEVSEASGSSRDVGQPKVTQVVGQRPEVIEEVHNLELPPIEDEQSNDLSHLPTRADYRKMTHKEVERRRRDRINTWIGELSKLVPGCDIETGRSGESKCAVLSRVCEYVVELKCQNDTLTEGVCESEQLALEAQRLHSECSRLQMENKLLTAQLRAHGIQSLPLSVPISLETSPSGDDLSEVLMTNSFKPNRKY